MTKEDKLKITEKIFIRFLLVKHEFEFKNEKPQYKLHPYIGNKIEEATGDLFVTSLIEEVINDLKERKIIKFVYSEEKGHEKEGKITTDLISNLQQYALVNNYIDDELLLNYTDWRYNDTIKIFMAQFQKMEKLEYDLQSQREELLVEIKEQRNQISRFYDNILSILGILVAIFAIIGFNIGGIKFIVGSNETLKPWVYVGSIAVINLSIILSIYFLFYLINKIRNPLTEIVETDKKKGINIYSKKILITILVLIILIIAICFLIDNYQLKLFQ